MNRNLLVAVDRNFVVVVDQNFVKRKKESSGMFWSLEEVVGKKGKKVMTIYS